MIKLSKQELLSLKNIVKVISCDFVDTRTTSKDFVRSTVALNILDDSIGQGFVLSTCLRYEMYHFEKKPRRNSNSLFHVSGILCLRRLFSLLVGLQSEIIGEKEILMQVTTAITNSHRNGHINDEFYTDLKNLIIVAEKIRDQYYINNSENYSTIAATMFVDYLQSHSKSTIAIVGGGYMVDKFFEALLRSSGVKIKNLLWLNRSTKKIENAILEIAHLLDFDVEVLSLSEGSVALKESNAIFCAVSNSPNLFSRTMLSNDVFVVDVSYPQVLEDSHDIKLINIANTNFSQLVKNPVPYTNIAIANRAIDELIKGIG